MILRFINIVVIGALVFAAAYVYRIKFESTVQAEHLAKLRSEVRKESDRIAALRAEWGTLDSPGRIEALAKRFTQLKLIAPTQFDALDRLPERPADDAHLANVDPIGGMIGNLDPPDTISSGEAATGPTGGAATGSSGDATTGTVSVLKSDAAQPAAENGVPDSGTLPSPDMTPADGRGEDEALSPADEDENR
jgi:hypothetical protein